MNRLFFLSVVVLLASHAHAATNSYTTSVTRTLSDANNFGKCMARVATPAQDEGLDCKGFWVTFSCSGDFVDRDVANRSFEIAQIAQLTGRSVRLLVDDTKKHNGYCLVSRIDLLSP